jgi:sugar phosphate isomerase/epimerase
VNTVFISTGGIRAKTAAETARDFHEHGIRAVELSGGAYSATQEKDLLSLSSDILLQVHNYFPPPAQPFVFNLASSDATLRDRSIQHVRSAMRLALAVGRPIYSFHAGFRINPRVSELGHPLGRSVLCEHALAMKQFGENVLLLAEEARREGITLLIENNVLNAVNFATFGEDPLLLTNPDEMIAFMQQMPDNVGLLLDVAHLKVSAATLGFDPIEAHAKVASWIRAYHLSDNDGTEDSNEAITHDSWFWEVIQTGFDYYSLEVYGVPTTELVSQYELAKKRLDEKHGIQKGIM